MDIQGKVFIVTGGASGLGEGTARMLAANGGKVVVADMQADKGQAVLLARRLKNLGFDLVATIGTAKRLREVGLECDDIFKVNEGRPNIADLIRQGEIALIINTPLGKASHFDEKAIRKAAL